MKAISMSDWSWTVTAQGMRNAEGFNDPGVRDLLVGWTDLPTDLPCRRGGLAHLDERATA
jgi:hypothetical protein